MCSSSKCYKKSINTVYATHIQCVRRQRLQDVAIIDRGECHVSDRLTADLLTPRCWKWNQWLWVLNRHPRVHKLLYQNADVTQKSVIELNTCTIAEDRSNVVWRHRLMIDNFVWLIPNDCILGYLYRVTHSAVLRSRVICLFVTWVDVINHIGWKTWKLFARTISPTPSLLAAERPSTYPKGTWGTWRDWRWGGNWKRLVFCSTKAAKPPKRVKIEEKLLWRAYRNLPTRFRTVPSLTPYGLLFPKIGGLQPQPKTPIATISETGEATNFKFDRVHP